MRHVHRGEAKRDKGCSRRAHRRDPGLLTVLGLLMCGVLGALVTCTPIRGYPGLERPKEEIALVTVASVEWLLTDPLPKVYEKRQEITVLNSLPAMAHSRTAVVPTPSLIRMVLIDVKKSARPISARAKKTPGTVCFRPIHDTAKPASAIIATQLARSPWRSSRAGHTNSTCLHPLASRP